MADLGGAGVHHGRREDGEDGRFRVEDALVEDDAVLLHAHVERHVVVFGPAAERVQQQHRLLKVAIQQRLPRKLPHPARQPTRTKSELVKVTKTNTES